MKRKRASKKRNNVHFSSKTVEWATPQYLFDELNNTFGPFDLDVCATKYNAKCAEYLSKEKGQDGLLVSWWAHTTDLNGDFPKCWMNPPYGRKIGKWVKKAYEESQKGCLVVSLLPARVDTRWFHDFIYQRPGVETIFLKGRVKFGNAENSAPFPSMVCVFNPPTTSKNKEAK